jgi:hypothetical protein
VKKLVLVIAVLVFALSGCGDGKGKYEVAPHVSPSTAS